AAVHALAEAPDAVRFLRERLTRPGVPPEYVSKLIAGLSATAFADRERATRELEALDELAKPGLEQALKAPLPPEARRRAQKLLDPLLVPTLTSERLRQWRAVPVLERIATP